MALRTSKPTGGSKVEAVLAIRPDEELGGASLDVPVVVRTRRGRLVAEAISSGAVLVLLGLAATSQGDGRWILGAVAVLLGVAMQIAGWVIPGISGPVQTAFKGSPPPTTSQQSATGGTAP